MKIILSIGKTFKKLCRKALFSTNCTVTPVLSSSCTKTYTADLRSVGSLHLVEKKRLSKKLCREEQIELEIDFPIKVVCSSRSKKLSLRIDAKKRIAVLSIPRFCSKKRAVDFVYENQEWIDVHLAKIPEKKAFADGEEIILFGQKIRIKHDTYNKGVYAEEGVLHVAGELEFLSRRVRDYIKERASKEFLHSSRKRAAKIGCEVKKVFIKDTKTRWASCSTLKNINFSWRIALAPDFVIDYLIAHEVAHLKHHDHSAEFWQCVVSLTDNRARGETWLRRHGNSLNIYE